MKKVMFLWLSVAVGMPAFSQKEPDEVIFTSVEHNPQYPGGFKEMQKFLSEKLQVEQDPKDAKSKERIFVKFVVEKDGTVSSVVPIRPENADKNFEKVKNAILQFPKWEAGMQNGKPVRVYFTLPVRIGETEKEFKSAVQFKGGEDSLYNFISKNLIFPVELIKNKRDYSTVIELSINENGKIIKHSISSPEIDECTSCKSEIERIIKILPDFIPESNQNIKNNPVQYIISFYLSWQKKSLYVYKPYEVKGWTGEGRKVYYPIIK